LLASPGQPRKDAAVASKLVFVRRAEQCCGCGAADVDTGRGAVVAGEQQLAATPCSQAV
jgi:hypothetical protein